MSERINIAIDVSKVNKNKFVERRYFDKENREITVRELKLEIVPLKERKLLSSGDTWELYKTHFVAYPQTKEEKDKKQKSTIIGDGTQFVPKVEKSTLTDQEKQDIKTYRERQNEAKVEYEESEADKIPW